MLVCMPVCVQTVSAAVFSYGCMTHACCAGSPLPCATRGYELMWYSTKSQLTVIGAQMCMCVVFVAPSLKVQ